MYFKYSCFQFSFYCLLKYFVCTVGESSHLNMAKMLSYLKGNHYVDNPVTIHLHMEGYTVTNVYLETGKCAILGIEVFIPTAFAVLIPEVSFLWKLKHAFILHCFRSMMKQILKCNLIILDTSLQMKINRHEGVEWREDSFRTKGSKAKWSATGTILPRWSVWPRT